MPQDRGHRRKHSRSLSPVSNKRKRSWQNASGGSGGRFPPPPRQRSPSPFRGGKKNFNRPPRSPGRFGGRKNFPGSPPGGFRRSRSPQPHKRPHPRSPVADRGPSPPYSRRSPMPPVDVRDRPLDVRDRPVDVRDRPVDVRDRPGSRPHMKGERSGSRLRQRSISPVPMSKPGMEGGKRQGKFNRLSRSPDRAPIKKKPRHSPSPPPKRSRSRSRGRSPVSSSRKRPESSSVQNRGGSIPQRKVSAPGKKKPPRITLHKRFTLEDQGPFELEENVTIAILRNPNVEPSEDVTVKRVFDASVFKMVHKKTEGRKPIFDREEIKVWRHDENLADDPDFERRLVRVKSSTTQASKPTADSLSRMSPDVIRKAFGLQVGSRSRSRSPHREPQIRLDPRPDPRYESKFRQQLEKEEELGIKKRRGDEEKRRGDDEGKRGSIDKRGGKGDLRDRDRRREEDRGGRNEGARGKGETYDLRQALERRRSDREEGGFRIEVRRGEGDSGAELFYRDDHRGREPSLENRRFLPDGGGGRNVVLDHDRDRGRFGGSMEREGRRSWDNDRRPPRGRGRGRGGRARGRRRDWSVERGGMDSGMRDEDIRDFRDRDRTPERRPRYSNSPPGGRGWRGGGGGFRGHGGRGRGRDFEAYSPEIVSPTDIDDSFNKYSQHDDRDVSPKPFRGRGGRNRFPSRSFGSSGFRATSRGSRGNRRTFRGGYRGRGFGSLGDRRSLDRVRDLSTEREWKHDMYDSLQAEEEQPHSTTMVP